MNRHAVALIVLAIVFLASTGEFSPAAASWDANGTPVCTATANQRLPRLVPDGAGGVVVTWFDCRGVTWDTYTQHLDRDGVSLWAANGIDVTPFSSDHNNPEPCTDGAGGAIVSWLEYVSLSKRDVYARRVLANGTITWATTGVAICTAAGNHTAHQIISDGAGGAIIVWADGRNGAYDIYAQRVNGSGVVQWPANGVAICTASNEQHYPQLVSDGAGGAIITWQDARNTEVNIYAQRVNPSGTPLWAANGVAVCTAVRDQYEPKMVSDGAGGAIITWTDTRATNQLVYAQRINPDGAMLWAADGVAVCGYFGVEVTPAIASDGAGGAIIAWSDGRSAGANDIYARRVSAGGTPMWAAEGVALCTALYGQSSPRIVADGAGGAIVVWQDWRNYSNIDIYIQRVSAGGTPMWQSDGVALCTAPSNQGAGDIESDGAGGAIIVWEDPRGGYYSDIYAAHVNAWGTSEPIATAFAAASAAVEDGCVSLSWRTMEDAAPASFTVERAEAEHGEYSAVAVTVSRESRGAFSCRDCSAEAGRTYWYEIVFSGASGEAVSEPMKVTLGPAVPAFVLHQCYPNPFNPSCTITYELPVAGHVNLSIYDVRGALVATLVDGWQGAGMHSLVWNGTGRDGASMSSGLYFYRLGAGKLEAMRRMVLLR